MRRGNQTPIDVGALMRRQSEFVPLVGGPFDGVMCPAAPDDGLPHVAVQHMPIEKQTELPLWLLVAFYRWNIAKRQWDFFSEERARDQPALKARMAEINTKGSHA